MRLSAHIWLLSVLLSSLAIAAGVYYIPLAAGASRPQAQLATEIVVMLWAAACCAVGWLVGRKGNQNRTGVVDYAPGGIEPPSNAHR